MEIAPLGDSALVVRIGNGQSDALNLILTVRRRLEHAGIAGVLEIVLGFSSIALYYDPVRLAASIGHSERILDWLIARVVHALAAPDAPTVLPDEVREVEIPVCFDPDFALDLNEVVRHTGIVPEQIIDS